MFEFLLWENLEALIKVFDNLVLISGHLTEYMGVIQMFGEFLIEMEQIGIYFLFEFLLLESLEVLITIRSGSGQSLLI